MYPQQQLPPGLPVDPRVPMHNYLMLQANNPPFCPNPASVTPDPQLQPYVPTIAGLAAMEVQGAAQQQPHNPLRMFMFNLLAQNNYANPEFEKLVAACTDFFWLNTVKGLYGQYPDAKLPEAVAQMTEMVRSVYLQTFPALQQFVDQALAHNASGLITMFGQIASEIQMWKQRVTQPGYGQVQQGGYGQPNYGQPNVQPPFQGRTYGTPMGSWQPQGQVALPPGQQLFGAQRPIVPNSGGVDTSRFDRPVARQPFVPVKTGPEPAPAAALPAPTPAPSPAPQAETEQLLTVQQIKWLPTEECPYIPAYDPAIDQLWFRPLASGGFKPVVTTRKEPLDYERHAISSTFGPRPRGMDPAKAAEALERVSKGVEQINQQTPTPEQASESVEEEVQLPFTQLIRPDLYIDPKDSSKVTIMTPRETTVAAVFLTAEIERLGRNIEGRPADIYRVHARLYDPVVGEADESHWVDTFGECETLAELRDKMVAAASEITPALYQTANRRMTQAINRAIRLNLSIPVLAIDSFVDDLDDLVKALERRGELILGSFTRKQRSLIQHQFGTLSDEEAAAESDCFVNPDEFDSVVPQITYLASNVTVNLLSCRAHELNVELAPGGIGTALQKSLTPMLYALVRGIFEAPTTKEFEENNGTFDRHFIRTVDGRVLEASRGWLDEDYFVLTLVE